MLKTYRIQEKVKGIGFDFPDSHTSFEKVFEEIKEFKNEFDKKNIEKATEEFGDVLFALIGFAQKVGINSLNALEKTNNKFIKRFNKMENIISKTKKEISDYSFEELDDFWQKTK